MLNLQEKYTKEIIPKLKEELKISNSLAVPRVMKVVVNTGVGKYQDDKKVIDDIAKDIATITGQRPSLRQARKAISGFKIRKGMIVGVAVTLRGKRMYAFLDRLINVALPRSRDFRGIKRRVVDRDGNLALGIKEQIIFPEISAEHARNIFGFEICINTSAKDRRQALALFELMGVPLQKEDTTEKKKVKPKKSKSKLK